MTTNIVKFFLAISLLVILLVNSLFLKLTQNSTKTAQMILSSPPIQPNIQRIYELLNYLPKHYYTKNLKFIHFQKDVNSYFNCSNCIDVNLWNLTKRWSSNISLFPYENGASGQLIKALKNSPVKFVDNALKGTQMKLFLLLENNQKVYFKPKRYSLDMLIKGKIYEGYDRHNAEVLAFYLAIILNYKWVAPVTTRRLHVKNQIEPAASQEFKIIHKDGYRCIYGKCHYCRPNETVCEDKNGFIEGAAILYFDANFKIFTSPWIRSYGDTKLYWEYSDDYCIKAIPKLVSKKRLLNLVDVAIIDFLIQNGDRHHYEVYKDRIVLLDNGKGLGNPNVDEMDILAPLYQCCMIQASSWRHLELLSGGSVTETLKNLSALHGDILASEDHFTAIERRLLKVYATVHYCFQKHGSGKVLQYL